MKHKTRSDETRKDNEVCVRERERERETKKERYVMRQSDKI